MVFNFIAAVTIHSGFGTQTLFSYLLIIFIHIFLWFKLVMCSGQLTLFSQRWLCISLTPQVVSWQCPWQAYLHHGYWQMLLLKSFYFLVSQNTRKHMFTCLCAYCCPPLAYKLERKELILFTTVYIVSWTMSDTKSETSKYLLNEGLIRPHIRMLWPLLFVKNDIGSFIQH